VKAYHKLVRDFIPEIIRADGKACDISRATSDDLKKLLEEKLLEEFNEYLEDNNLEELADMMEVIFGLAHQLGYSEEQLLAKRSQKLKERGGFKGGIVLEKVY